MSAAQIIAQLAAALQKLEEAQAQLLAAHNEPSTPYSATFDLMAIWEQG